MTKRSAKSIPSILAVILAVIVAGPPLTAIVGTSAQAADNCLTNPKGEAPEGRHWYYRIERGTGRHCWYIRDEKDADEKTAASAPVDLSPPKSVAPPKPAPAPKSIADARAELPLPQTRIEQDFVPTTAPRLPAPRSADADRPAIAGNPDGQSSALTTRWPQPSGVNSSVNPVPAGGDRVADLQSNSGTAVPPPPTGPVATVAADSSPQRPPASPWMLLIVVFGALALAGIIGSAILRFAGSRRSRRRPVRSDRRAIWDSIDAGRPARPVPDAARRQNGFTNDTSRVDEASERIAEMLEQLRGRA